MLLNVPRQVGRATVTMQQQREVVDVVAEAVVEVVAEEAAEAVEDVEPSEGQDIH